MAPFQNNPKITPESIVTDFILKNFGHFVLASDDRIFVNTLRRALVTELGLPSNCMSIISQENHIIKDVKELCVKKKSLVLFIQTTLDYKRTDETIRYLVAKMKNCKVVLLTTEQELHQLALLREQGLAENWIVKPIILNQLVPKVASVIMPYGPVARLIAAAEEHLSQRAYNNVLTICSKIFEIKQDSAVAHMLMGDAYLALDQIDQMVEAYEHASYMDPLFLDPLKKLVEYFLERGDTERAVQYMERLDTISPLNLERKMEIAKLHLELGNEEDAKGEFETLMKQANKKVLGALSETATQIGDIYAKAGNPEALKYYHKAIEVYGENIDASQLHLFNNLAISMRKMGKSLEAIEVYDRALTINPQDESVYYNKALAYDDCGDKQNALRSIQKAISLNEIFFKDNYLAAYNIAMIYAKSGMAKQAMQYLTYSLKINPENEKSLELYKCLKEECKTP
jgi:tetratricopeptide (TPR) repeat protein